MSERPEHWNRRYASAELTGLSWYEPEPATSLALIDRLGVSKEAPVIDIGGGASFLVDRLAARGYDDLAVLDVSSTALEIAQQRVGDAAPVRWLRQDILTWKPEPRYLLWHDRAVFHFLTHITERTKYLEVMRQALGHSAVVILATFALDGPTHCSGLPVARYGAAELEHLLEGFTVVKSCREEHVTPRGVVQPLTWVAARRGKQRRGRGAAQLA